MTAEANNDAKTRVTSGQVASKNKARRAGARRAAPDNEEFLDKRAAIAMELAGCGRQNRGLFHRQCG